MCVLGAPFLLGCFFDSGLLLAPILVKSLYHHRLSDWKRTRSVLHTCTLLEFLFVAISGQDRGCGKDTSARPLQHGFVAR